MKLWKLESCAILGCKFNHASWTCCLPFVSALQKFISVIIALVATCQDGRVGLRRQFQVLVRKGMGSNPILDIYFYLF